MASTTLMTFRLQVPRSIYNVNLLGSWDNFSKPYPMQKDPRTGGGHWRGCHSFTNIVCDGDVINAADGRNGGLKMGGTYWYYYQLNSDIECHNAAEPSTTSCPFLPGQIVNILEVPIQVKDVTHSRIGSASSTGSIHYTLNPEDKYLGLRTPIEPKIRGPEVSVPSTWNSGELQTQHEMGHERLLQPSYPAITVDPSVSLSQSCRTQSASHGRRPSTSPQLPLDRTVSSLVDRRFRRTQSARTIALAMKDEDRPLSRAGTRQEAIKLELPSEFTFETSESHCPLESMIQEIEVKDHSSENPASAPDDAMFGFHIDKDLMKNYHCARRTPEQSPEASNPLMSCKYDEDCTPTINRSWQKHVTARDSIARDELDRRLSLDDSELTDPTAILVDLYTEVDDTSQVKGDRAESTSSSAWTSGPFSPSLTCSTTYSGYMSPLHMGQPNTPETNEFQECFLSLYHDNPSSQTTDSVIENDNVHPDRAYLNSGGSGVYNLPEMEHASAVTIRSLAPNYAKAAATPLTYKGTSSQDRVTSWNDGSPALEDLFNELSYLGEIIT